MKKIFLSVCLMASFLTGCSGGDSTVDKRVVIQINKFSMNVEDLKYELKNIPPDDLAVLKTEDGRKKYLEGLIEKKILLQEAQRQGIDRDKDFMKSIERYWEQALLKLLLQRKSDQISRNIHIYDNEIDEYYKNSGETAPLAKIRFQIKQTISQQKETEAMDTWIDELRKDSHIKINEDILKDIFSK